MILSSSHDGLYMLTQNGLFVLRASICVGPSGAIDFSACIDFAGVPTLPTGLIFDNVPQSLHVSCPGVPGGLRMLALSCGYTLNGGYFSDWSVTGVRHSFNSCIYDVTCLNADAVDEVSGRAICTNIADKVFLTPFMF